MSEKLPETLETQHRRVAMTYLVRNYGGAGSLDGARPHTRHARRRPRERRRCRVWGGCHRTGYGTVRGLLGSRQGGGESHQIRNRWVRMPEWGRSAVGVGEKDAKVGERAVASQGGSHGLASG